MGRQRRLEGEEAIINMVLGKEKNKH